MKSVLFMLLLAVCVAPLVSSRSLANATLAADTVSQTPRANLFGQDCNCKSYVIYTNGKKSKPVTCVSFQAFSYTTCPTCCYCQSPSSSYRR